MGRGQGGDEQRAWFSRGTECSLISVPWADSRHRLQPHPAKVLLSPPQPQGTTPARETKPTRAQVRELSEQRAGGWRQGAGEPGRRCLRSVSRAFGEHGPQGARCRVQREPPKGSMPIADLLSPQGPWAHPSPQHRPGEQDPSGEGPRGPGCDGHGHRPSFWNRTLTFGGRQEWSAGFCTVAMSPPPQGPLGHTSVTRTPGGSGTPAPLEGVDGVTSWVSDCRPAPAGRPGCDH